MIEHEIQAFGRRLGMESLALNHDGMAQLDIEGIGSFFLERQEKGGQRHLLVYLSAPVQEYDADAYRRLLEHCDYRKAYPLPLSSGVFSGKAVLLTYLDEHTATAADIENAFRFLAEIMYE